MDRFEWMMDLGAHVDHDVLEEVVIVDPTLRSRQRLQEAVETFFDARKVRVRF